jgi:hypothetical protein
MLRIASLMFALVFSLAPTANAQNGDAGQPNHYDGHADESSTVAPVDEQTWPADLGSQTARSSICQLIESAAAANGLPFVFFARLIWQESRFRADAVGPLTRNGHKAQGIAQFMPLTATERLLRDPFDPAQALPKSAEFLHQLRLQFGNLGLAAAAYNAGPQRVQDWLAGKRALPSETLAYVRIVTGHSAEEWMRASSAGVMLSIAAPPEIPCVDPDMRIVKLQSPTQPEAAKAVGPGAAAKGPERAALTWGVQLIGDRSEPNAIAAYRQLQKRHDAILRSYEPVLVRTMIRGGTVAIWNRVRIETGSRQSAELLCSKLRAARETCLVQRN